MNLSEATIMNLLFLSKGTGATLLHYPKEFCQRLASEGYRIIRFDNRDIGASSKLDSLGQPNWEAIIPLMKTCDSVPLHYTLLDMSNDVVGLMDALKIKSTYCRCIYGEFFWKERKGI